MTAPAPVITCPHCGGDVPVPDRAEPPQRDAVTEARIARRRAQARERMATAPAELAARGIVFHVPDVPS